MNSIELKERTLDYGIRVMNMAEKLPPTKASNIISDQIMRAAFSVGANYRAACRAKSARDFINKLKIVLEESDETMYWMQVIVKAQIIEEAKMSAIMREADELTAIFAAALKTAISNSKKEKLSKA